MTWVKKIQAIVEGVAALPGFRGIEQNSERRRFLENQTENLFFGVFDTFDAAKASAPSNLQLGYDNDDSANIDYVSTISPRDYPAMFWLLHSFHDGMRSVFDLGGHVGVKYYAFRRAMGFPSALKWLVCDVPAVVVRGREMAAARAPEGNLSFTDRFSDASGNDILFASGSLQYLPMELSEILRNLQRLPRRIIVNTTPVHKELSYFTLNSIGTAYCPYRIQARNTFVDSIQALGYYKRDEWENTGKGMEIPGNRTFSLDAYSGFCFDLKA
jgi:putative methyltransferase (TIGR04325 family)